MGLKFLIIVPHGYCDESWARRHCDRRAMEEAEKLKNLVKSRGHTVDFFKADRFRCQLDYNRMKARYSPIRNKIRKLMEKYSADGHHIIVFEMHSFPDNYKDQGYNFEDGKLGMISIPRYENDMYFLSDYIQKNTGLKIVPLTGTKTNDVQWDSSETVSKNINHYLIEFRENKDAFADSDSDKIRPVLLEGAIKFAKRQPRVVVMIAQVALTIIFLLLLAYLVLHKIPQAELARAQFLDSKARDSKVGMSV